ncbi:MAG: FAD-binding monooxygenase [Caldilineaceae bacterium]|nr:FAD-binding monooxygenase [Caldilineaceae bacterium]
MRASDSNSKFAVVIGGSMAGLLTARVLSDHFAHVTVLERDKVGDQPEARKGQAHTKHLHALLAAGFEVMTSYFPDLPEALAEGGAILEDMPLGIRWYGFGGYRKQFKSGLIGLMTSRPFLEWQIRQRVQALPNVTLLDECAVDSLLTTGGQDQVTGVRYTRRGEMGTVHELHVDLVVDASGRGSSAPKWLEVMGYGKPAESTVKVNVGYATRIYRRQHGDVEGAFALIASPDLPDGRRAGYAFPVEGDRWYMTLSGHAGDYPPTDEEGYLAYARSLPAPDIYNLIRRLEPLTDIVPYRYPASVRRHYEKMARFPEGFLVLGDAICSFNPVYGQGMTSAALQTKALERLIAARGTAGIARPFFKEIAKIVDIPWQLSVGEDFRFPETEGKKAPGTDLINFYVEKVHRATQVDTTVYQQFLQVMNLLAPPSSLMKPRMMWRVFRAVRALRKQGAARMEWTEVADPGR